jgi:hypothetical protein
MLNRIKNQFYKNVECLIFNIGWDKKKMKNENGGGLLTVDCGLITNYY